MKINKLNSSIKVIIMIQIIIKIYKAQRINRIILASNNINKTNNIIPNRF